MRRFDLVLFSLIFIYLLSGWTGFWSVQQTEIEGKPVKIIFEPGFFETLMIEGKFLEELQDPLVESDSRPDRLFDHAHRNFTKNFVLAGSCAFLLVFTALTTIAGFSGRWFYSRMKRMVFVPVTLFLLASLLLSPREPPLGLIALSDQILYYSPFVVKSMLLFLSTAGWMAPTRLAEERDFLTHMRHDRSNIPRQLREKVLPAATDLFLISVAGAAITNVVLLPFFQVQIHFAEYFVFILIPGLIILAFFYSGSYRNVARMRGEDPSWGTALAFLSFRMMRNFLYLSALLVVVLLVLAAIVTFSYSNLNLLIEAGIVTESPGL